MPATLQPPRTNTIDNAMENPNPPKGNDPIDKDHPENTNTSSGPPILVNGKGISGGQQKDNQGWVLCEELAEMSVEECAGRDSAESLQVSQERKP
ncbi:hypothetical protein FQN50_004004 [Emmonsiellopsis sp. PD_5]|nr:hypothetical protein FQN50_004004 [Emmonsiellopsis sp. PD_5]